MIPFSPPHINQEVIDEVVDTLKSGWITTGPKTKLFEKQLSKYCNVESLICISSATFGLEIILRWFGVTKGDEVIIPAFTYAATANAIIHTGATPVMVDCNLNDFNINVDAVKNAITSKTKVIMPVDIAGLPNDFTLLNETVKLFNIKKQFKATSKPQKKLARILILSDSAHSFGATYKNKISGNLTDISVFSFHAVKNLTTSEGGAIALNLPKPFNNKELYKYLNMLSLHGQNKDAFAKTLKGNWKYDILVPGYKGNMTDINASIGLIGLKYYNSKNLPRRREIFSFYQSKFLDKKWAETPVFIEQNKESSYHLYLLRIKNINEKTRDTIIEDIFNNNVSVNVHFEPLPSKTAYKFLNYKKSDFPNSYNNYQRLISLPVYQDLTNIQLNEITEVVISAVENNLHNE
ncbi:MAG TPA: capsular biosynthesis protein [Flavobacteriaceae bacterium]|jgi:dTDP-4-amino-4,6-dideoxygalactose transaminase|nr:capsular biosynthesis protein [Flavobacteriaceae bacterium]